MRPLPAPRWPTHLGALVTAAVCAVVLLIAGASSASAHDYLVSSNPADGSVVRVQPGALSATFNDLVLDSSAISDVAQVIGPDGQHYESACPKVLGRTITVPVGLGPAGAYVFRWRIVSADGHPVTQNINFTYKPGATAMKKAGTQASRCTSTSTSNASGAATQAAAPAQKAGSTLSAPLIATGVILVLALVAVWLLLRRRRPNSTSIGDDSSDDDE